MLIHHPEDAEPMEGITFLSSDVAQPARIGLETVMGDGIRLVDEPGGASVYLSLVNAEDPTAVANLRYRPR